MMDVGSVGAEQRLAAQGTPHHRERGIEDRQSEGDDGNADGDQRGAFLRARQRQRAKKEADKQAAAVTQKDGRRIEVIAQEPQDGAGQHDAEHRHHGRTAEQRGHKDHQRRKQRGAGGKAVDAINEVKGIRDP